MRDVTLTLRVFDSVAYYHCNYNYTSESSGCGVCIGRVYPDGHLFGMAFSQLQSLGTGTHKVRISDGSSTLIGTPQDLDEGQRAVESFRFTIFGHDHGAFTRCDVLMRALMAFQKPFQSEVLTLAPAYTRDSLREYALEIPEDLSNRGPNDFTFFSSSGRTAIPNENLLLLRNMLGSKDCLPA